MKQITNKFTLLAMAAILAGAVFSIESCSKSSGSGTPAVVEIGGYPSSDSVAASNLVLYWNFDNNATEQKLGLAGTASGVTYVTGIRGQAYQGAKGAYISVSTGTDSSSLASQFGSYSVSLWYSLPSAAKPQPGTSDPGGIFFMGSAANPNEMILETDIPSATQLAADSVPIHHGFDNVGGVSGSWQAFTMVSFDTSVATWVHIVMTYNGGTSTYTFYQNAVAIDVSSAYGVQTPSILYDGPLPLGSGTPPTQLQGNLTLPAGNYPSNIYIGTWPPGLYGVSPTLGANGSFMGAIDELRVFNTALDPQEVSGLYLNGLAGR